MADLFKGAMLVRTLVGSMIIIAISVALYGFVGWLPTFFVKQGLDLNHSLGFTAAMTLGSPLGNAFAMWLSDKGGRKAGLLGFTLAAAVLGVVYPFAGAGLQVVLIGFLLVFCIGVMIGVGWAVYVSELFPTEMRMRGVGICNTAGRVVSIATPYAVVGLFNFGGVSAVVFTLAGILVAMALLVALFGIETRSRSLEDLRPEEAAPPLAALPWRRARGPEGADFLAGAAGTCATRPSGTCGMAGMAAPGQDGAEPGLWAAGEAYEPYVGRWSRLVAVEFLRRLGIPPAPTGWISAAAPGR
ncbi:MFS transporter [Pseudoroseomonas wenyumeiae]